MESDLVSEWGVCGAVAGVYADGEDEVMALYCGGPTPPKFQPLIGDIVRVRFTDVGPSKFAWTSDTIPLTEDALYREVKRHRALGSRDIDFNLDDGGIYVGMFRRVGTFEVLEVSPLKLVPTPNRRHA